jgi:AcrR family transcriptional regulator
VATQAERSADTRGKLLDATVAVLVERGYRAASTPEICRRAGVSRGAQLHHYPTKEQLVAAALEHLFERRVAELAQRLRRAEARQLEDVAAYLWSVYASDTYYAWLELLVAARTDEALRDRLREIDGKLVAQAERLCAELLLPHVEDREEIAATTRLILAIFDGLASHRIVASSDAVAKRALRIARAAGLFAPRKDRGRS